MARGTYTERETRIIFKQLTEGMAYLHKVGIAHRDIKLENLLLGKSNDINTIKIADFGLAKKVTEADLSTVCGTPHYMAPEIVQPGRLGKAYSKAVDVWSCGLVLFCLMAGFFPFHDESENKLYEKIRSGRVSFTHTSGISIEARHLIKKMLTVNPAQRRPPWTCSSTHGCSANRIGPRTCRWRSRSCASTGGRRVPQCTSSARCRTWRISSRFSRTAARMIPRTATTTCTYTTRRRQRRPVTTSSWARSRPSA